MKDRFGKEAQIIGVKQPRKVDFPSNDMWVGIQDSYALMLNEEQLKDLHRKIHEQEKELGHVLL